MLKYVNKLENQINKKLVGVSDTCGSDTIALVFDDGTFTVLCVERGYEGAASVAVQNEFEWSDFSWSEAERLGIYTTEEREGWIKEREEKRQKESVERRKAEYARLKREAELLGW